MILFKALRKGFSQVKKPFYTPLAKLILVLNGAKYNKGMYINGFIRVNVTRKGTLVIGENFKANSGNKHNVIGRQQKLIFWVNGSLIIGDNVGMSSSAIICHESVTIGNNVTIGGNVVIYDTDFHSIDPIIRASIDDLKSAKKKPVTIKNNAFIGAHTTILKGVTIGENAVVGACSVVTKDIPENEIWAGNPVRFIKKIG